MTGGGGLLIRAFYSRGVLDASDRRSSPAASRALTTSDFVHSIRKSREASSSATSATGRVDWTGWKQREELRIASRSRSNCRRLPVWLNVDGAIDRRFPILVRADRKQVAGRAKQNARTHVSIDRKCVEANGKVTTLIVRCGFGEIFAEPLLDQPRHDVRDQHSSILSSDLQAPRRTLDLVAFRVAHLSVGQTAAGEDRVAVLVHPDRIVIGVVDGAGGTGRGGEAADTVIDRLREHSDVPPFDLVGFLQDCDLELSHKGRGGETTAVVVVVDENGIRGASVGDSGAWLVASATHVDLTRQQIRKPLIGTGEAVPIPFVSGPLEGTLLVATDGLLKYSRAARIREILSESELDEAPRRLIDSVRLHSGVLQDDTTVVICRRI